MSKISALIALIVTCSLITGCDEWRPPGVPKGAEYTGTWTWDGRWVYCDSWTVGDITHCSMYKGTTTETGVYLIDGREVFGGVLTNIENKDSGDLTNVVSAAKRSGLFQSDWVESQSVHVRPINASRKDADGTIDKYIILPDYKKYWGSRNLQTFLQKCSLSFDISVENRIKNMIYSVYSTDLDITITDISTEYANGYIQSELLLGGEQYTFFGLGGCWFYMGEHNKITE